MVKRLMPILAALLLFAAAQIHALSLGDITLESAAGEPLQASIELLDSEGLSAFDISVRVASAADFQRFGAERIAALDNLSVVVEFVDDVPVLRVSSPVSINEPFLSLLLDTRWPAGRVLTEYTVRLESPAFSAQSDQQITAAPVQSVFEPVADDADTDTVGDSETVEQAASAGLAATDTPADDEDTSTTRVAPAAASGQSEPVQRAPAAAPEDLANASTLTVNAGDTLWELALRARPDNSVSVQQTMLALQRLNPDAFLGNNINRVMRGEVLRVPELNEIRRLAAAWAIAEVSRQNREFAQPGANAVGSEPVTAGPGTAANGAAQGQLRVVTADDDSEESADASASAASAQSAEQDIARTDEQLDEIEDSLAQREEDLDRLDLENTELSTRLAMLQQQIASAQEIIRLRDLELAQLQQQLADAEPAEAAASSEQTTTITMAPDASPVERFFNMLISNTWALLAAAAVLVLVLVLVLMRRNRAALTQEQRAQRDNDDMPLGEQSEDELLFSGVAAAAAAATPENDAEPASLERADDSQEQGAVTDDGLSDDASDDDFTDDDFPGDNNWDEDGTSSAARVGDAEGSGNADKQGLLDDEFALDDAPEADRAAGKPVTGPAVPGNIPGNNAGNSTDGDADEGPDWGDTDLDLEDDEDNADNEAGEFDEERSDDDDLSWSDADDADDADEAEAPVSDADYDIYDDAGEKAEAATPAIEPQPAPQPEPQPESKPEPEAEADTVPADDDSKGETSADDEFDNLTYVSDEDSFDDDEEEGEDEEFAFLSDSDEATTKLDLARAYIDMGDSDGAQEILLDVVKQGTEAQRRDAQSLLERL